MSGWARCAKYLEKRRVMRAFRRNGWYDRHTEALNETA